MNNAIIIFDTECIVCNKAINVIIKNDKKGYFNFLSLSSSKSKNILSVFPDVPELNNTLILIDNNKLYTRSSAVLKICNRLGGIHKLANIFYIIPSAIRDSIYKIFANNRYKWFGKTTSCKMPDQQIRARFLDI